MRYLINNNPSSVELLSQTIHHFFLCLKNYVEYLKTIFFSSNKDCFFKLITCILVTLKKICIISKEISIIKLKHFSLQNYLSIVETISKMDRHNFTYDSILKEFNVLSKIPSSNDLK